MMKSDTGCSRLGNQIHSHEYYRTCVRAIPTGTIGKVKEVHNWCAVTRHGKSFHISRPKHPVEVSSTLNWNRDTMQINNHDEANQWLRSDYRDGWDIAPAA